MESSTSRGAMGWKYFRAKVFTLPVSSHGVLPTSTSFQVLPVRGKFLTVRRSPVALRENLRIHGTNRNPKCTHRKELKPHSLESLNFSCAVYSTFSLLALI
jgi:hypothetical protein